MLENHISFVVLDAARGESEWALPPMATERQSGVKGFDSGPLAARDLLLEIVAPSSPLVPAQIPGVPVAFRLVDRSISPAAAARHSTRGVRLCTHARHDRIQHSTACVHCCCQTWSDVMCRYTPYGPVMFCFCMHRVVPFIHK